MTTKELDDMTREIRALKAKIDHGPITLEEMAAMQAKLLELTRKHNEGLQAWARD